MSSERPAEATRPALTRRQCLKAMAAAGAAALLPHVGCSDNAALTTLNSYEQLAELPFFERDSKTGLMRAAIDLPPAIDFHTHLGISVLTAPEIDLQKRTERTEYLISCEADQDPPCVFDFEDYINGLATDEVKAEMDKEILAMALGGSTRAATQTVPNLVAELDALGMDAAVVLPIALGFPKRDDLTERWHAAIEGAKATDRLVAFCSVHPSDENAVEKIRTYKSLGMRGIKVHPPMQRVYADEADMQPIYAECETLDLPVFYHTGRTGLENDVTRRYAEMKYYEQPVADYPKLRFVFGHSGARDFDEALPLAKRYKNVWLDCHGQCLAHLESMIDEVGPERIFFGSDWPFYPIATTLAKVLIATEGDSKVRDLILADNAQAFLGLS